jgi:glycosyltransferase involved in cell wall biosynthesis
MVSPFPPANDGIGTYADQLAAALGSTRRVRRLALPGGDGDAVKRLDGGLRPLRILRQGVRASDVVVQYHPHYFIQGPMRSRIAAYASLLLVSRLRRTTFVVHEQDDPVPPVLGPVGTRVFGLEEWLRRRLWARRVSLVFHTEPERREFGERFPSHGRRELTVTHGAFFTTSVNVSRELARERLGLPAGRTLLLCIGFFSPDKPDKAYDAAIRAVAEARVEDLELHVVGSAIARPVPEVREYVELLRGLAAETPRVELHEGFVSDEEFDLWLRAADAVVVPYREATSSGVVARALLLGTPLIARSVGGIEQQLRPTDLRFGTDEELVDAIRAFAARDLAV